MTASNTEAKWDKPERDRIFMLTLVAKASPNNPGHDPIRSLRWLLKIALRRFHLRCTSLRELVP